MTICRYFLNGYCRFGDRCRYEHGELASSYRQESLISNNNYSNRSSYNGSDRNNSNVYENRSSYKRKESTQYKDPHQSYYNQFNQHCKSDRRYQSERYNPDQANRFCQNKRKWICEDYVRQRDRLQNTDEYNTSPSNIRVNFSVRDPEIQRSNHHVDLCINEEKLIYVNLIKEDIKEWELGSQWPFTCYSPLFKSNFPEFFDISPEELRYEAYKARDNNTVDLYLKSVYKTLQNLSGLRNQLKNPPAELVPFIVDYCARAEDIIEEVDDPMLADESSC